MKHYFFSVLTIASCLVAKADDFNLGAHGNLMIPVSASWIAKSQEHPGMGYEIAIESKNGANAVCQIMVIYAQKPLVVDKEKAKAALSQIADQFSAGSVEKKAVLKDFSLKAGVGMYCSFTDAGLVGKPPSQGNYKTMSPGVIYLSNDVALAVTILTDDLSGPEFKQLLGTVQSIELKPASKGY